MIPKVIKTDEQYSAVLARIETLINEDVKPGTERGDELDVLVTLVELYESKHIPIGLPNPIEAIRFRMEQSGLRQQDLVPYIGNRSKVSEVLNGKRPLSLNMIRALHTGLGIPAEVLLQGVASSCEISREIDVNKFPISEIIKRKWIEGFKGSLSEAKKCAGELVKSFLKPVTSELQPCLFRQHLRSGSEMDPYALLAWRAKVTMIAREHLLPKYIPGVITPDFMRSLVGLSYLNEGPRLAQEFLAKNGICLVVLYHLPKTHLDGAAWMRQSGTPIVALTLRHDRLDNFWFTLCHEIGHLALHFTESEFTWFVDDLDANGDALEIEADRFARDSLIAPQIWERTRARDINSADDVRQIAKEIRIHPAILAGRIRHEEKNYKVLSSLVGQGMVRGLFPSASGEVEKTSK